MPDETSISLGEGGNSFPFEDLGLGAEIEGEVIDFASIQMTNMDTGDLEFWPDGKAKMQIRVSLQTNVKDADVPDGIWTVYLRGGKKAESMSTMAAIAGAMKAAGASNQLRIGDRIGLKWVSERPVPGKKYKAKCYTGTWSPKTVSLGNDGPAPSAVSQPASASAVSPATRVTADALTPEQIAALIASASKPVQVVDVIAAHPQGAALRQAGVPDDVIRASLGLG